MARCFRLSIARCACAAKSIAASLRVSGRQRTSITSPSWLAPARFSMAATTAPLLELDQAMAAAVASRQFEQAARLHEIRTDLETLRDRLLPRPHEEPRSFVYPVTRGRRAMWMVIHAGTVHAVRGEPSTGAAAGDWLARLAELPRASSVAIDERDASESRIVHAWFRQHPDELGRTMTFDAARAFCRQIAPA